MKFIIIGSGSIGQRHISNIKKINHKHDVDVFDLDKRKLQKLKHLDVNFLNRIDNLKSKYDCAFICTPPISHVQYARKFLNEKIHVFIEKPLSITNIGISNLEKLTKQNSSLAFVGYNFRFNDGINLIKSIIMKQKLGKPLHASAYFGQYLPDWRPSQNYKKNYSAIKKMGGGIILDSSHEIDYLRWIFDEPKSVQSEFSYVNNLKTNVEGIAEIILKFQNNMIASIHLDFIRRDYKRGLEILCENGIINWSLKDRKIRIFNSQNNSWRNIRLKQNTNDMYVEEIKHIIKCIRNNRKSKIIDLENGINTFNISQLIIKSGHEGKRILI